MSNVSVRISLQESLLADIDAEAERESRSELLRVAARLYVRRQQKWDGLFALGDRLAENPKLTRGDVARQISVVRRLKSV